MEKLRTFDRKKLNFDKNTDLTRGIDVNAAETRKITSGQNIFGRSYIFEVDGNNTGRWRLIKVVHKDQSAIDNENEKLCEKHIDGPGFG